MNLYTVEDNQVKPLALRKIPKPLERVVEECKGWHQYKMLYEETKDARYSKMALDEFKHMLAAIQDSLREIENCASAEEAAEIAKFLEAVSKR